ncbi:hypothetical protein [Haemophilus pittmaniae]|nr:hypothetical protein [Haemophilus pittmaniae]
MRKCSEKPSAIHHMKGQNMINGLDIERFRTTMAAVENDHTKGKAALRADSRWVSGTKNEISVRRFPAFTTDEPKTWAVKTPPQIRWNT